MRDLILIVLLAVAVVATPRKPLWEALVWIFLSISSIHQLGYTTATLPVAMVIGLCLVVSVLAHRSEFYFSWTNPLVWLALFTLWINVTYVASFQLEENYSMWEQVMKINFFMFVVSGVILTRKDVDLVIWGPMLAHASQGRIRGLGVPPSALRNPAESRIFRAGRRLDVSGNSPPRNSHLSRLAIRHHPRAYDLSLWLRGQTTA